MGAPPVIGVSMNFRSSVRLALILAALLLGGAITPKDSTSSLTGEQLAAQEVRIRKLHLVRPDLLPYPLFYEVVC